MYFILKKYCLVAMSTEALQSSLQCLPSLIPPSPLALWRDRLKNAASDAYAQKLFVAGAAFLSFCSTNCTREVSMSAKFLKVRTLISPRPWKNREPLIRSPTYDSLSLPVAPLNWKLSLHFHAAPDGKKKKKKKKSLSQGKHHSQFC